MFLLLVGLPRMLPKLEQSQRNRRQLFLLCKHHLNLAWLRGKVNRGQAATSAQLAKSGVTTWKSAARSSNARKLLLS